jgi:hypothetical protein
MSYLVTEHRIGVPNISSVSDAGTPEVKVGTIVRAEDEVYGAGEFIYLPCLSGQIVGSLVTYTMGSGVSPTTTAAVSLTTSTKNQARPVAVSMAANSTGTTKYGWFAIQGSVPVKKTAVRVNPNVAVFLGTTSGRVGPASGSGKQVLGARTMNTATVASATSTVLVQINRPHLQGQTT